MSADEDAASEQGVVHQLKMRVSDLDDYAKEFLASRISSNEDEIDALHDRIDELEATVEHLDSEMESFIGVSENQRSTPEKRAADLRQAMIRAARNTSAEKGVKWWKDNVAEHLAAVGHKDLHKPDYYDAMEDAAEADGFEETTKTVTKDGRTWDAKAIRVTLSELPGGDSR